jgi:acetylornithine/succinyldiaminopimelate/putrescine aminotransferase
MVGIEMDVEVAPIIAAGYERGLILLNAGPNVLRLLPPLIVQAEHIERLIDVLREILASQVELQAETKPA